MLAELTPPCFGTASIVQKLVSEKLSPMSASEEQSERALLVRPASSALVWSGLQARVLLEKFGFELRGSCSLCTLAEDVTLCRVADVDLDLGVLREKLPTLASEGGASGV